MVSSAKRIGLALSGGAALGAAHVGVLEVLQAHDVQPYCVVGTSAGSVVAAAYCAGMPVDEMKDIALHLDWTRVGRPVLPRRGFLDGARLEELLINLLGDVRFEDLPVRCATVAADLLTDSLVVFREGRVAPAVRASCALPGVFTPIEDEDHVLVDGGIINNLPVSVAKDLGADYVIAVDLSARLVGRRHAPASGLELLFLSLMTLLRNTSREAELAELVVQPEVGEFSPADLGKVREIIERGRAAMAAALPKLLRDLEGE